MSAALPIADLPAGFAQPGPASQQVFRQLLQALSRPGLVMDLPSGQGMALAAPAGLSPALAAGLLTLLDHDTRLWLSPALGQPLLRGWLSFHTGVVLVDAPEHAQFAAAQAHEISAGLWRRLPRGGDEQPQDGATLLLDLPAWGADARLQLQGPGLPAPLQMPAGPVAAEVWRCRQADQADYPLGIDLLLCCGTQWRGLPRSTRLQLLD